METPATILPGDAPVLPLEISVQTYDGCDRVCPGCVVDRHTRNRHRFRALLQPPQLRRIRDALRDYLPEVRAHGAALGFNLNSLTWRFEFGNHSELPFDELRTINRILDVPCGAQAQLSQARRQFHCAPWSDWERYLRLQDEVPGRYVLEIVYNPLADNGTAFASRVRRFGVRPRFDILPEITVTRRLLERFTPRRMYETALAPLEGLLRTVRFSRYVPSATRGFSTAQAVPLDEEVEWLRRLAVILVERNSAVTLGPYVRFGEHAGSAPGRRPGIRHQARLFRFFAMRSVYIDRTLAVHVNLNNLGDLPLTRNYNYRPLGNLDDGPLASLYGNNRALDEICRAAIASMITHHKCPGCRQYMRCLADNVAFYRRFEHDSGRHCYGYLPVVASLRPHAGVHPGRELAC